MTASCLRHVSVCTACATVGVKLKSRIKMELSKSDVWSLVKVNLFVLTLIKMSNVRIQCQRSLWPIWVNILNANVGPFPRKVQSPVQHC